MPRKIASGFSSLRFGKIGKKAKLEQLEPMEIVQLYTNRYHKNMEDLNTLPPSIEPHASGHIIEQQELIKKIIDNAIFAELNWLGGHAFILISETNQLIENNCRISIIYANHNFS